jgi:hypothetical protein
LISLALVINAMTVTLILAGFSPELFLNISGPCFSFNNLLQARLFKRFFIVSLIAGLVQGISLLLIYNIFLTMMSSLPRVVIQTY